MTLDELQNWPPQIKALADAASKHGEASQQAADKVQAIVDVSTWKGDAGDAARDAMTRSAARFQTAGSQATAVAMQANKAYGESQTLAADIGSFLADAAAPPTVIIDPKTNGVTPPDITGMDKDQLQTVINKLKDLKTRVTGLLARGDTLDDELARMLDEGTGGNTMADKLSGEEMRQPEMRRRAEQDVQDALAGDEEAAKRVETVLNGIKPAQELTAEQGSYLSQMQAQQKGMTVEELKTAEARLGDQKHIIGDSWQLMSNENVRFPKTETTVDALDDPNNVVKGGFDQLPDSARNTILNGGYDTQADPRKIQDLTDITDMVRDGRRELQTGTEIDRELIRLADRRMDLPPPSDDWQVRDIFTSAGRDHQVIHDHLRGDDGNDFLHDITAAPWVDKGAAAGSLFSWTNEQATGPEAEIAAETAQKYATYIGSDPKLLTDQGPFANQTLGQVNPELVKAFAHGLTPYMDDIASVSGAGRDGDKFDPLDPTNSERPNAKRLFAVLGTQQDAYVEFNGAADRLALDRAHNYAEDVKNGVPVSKDDARLLDSAILKGLVASGTAEGLHAIGLNDAEAQKWRGYAYDAGAKTLLGSNPLVGAFAAAMKDSIIGAPPNTSTPVVPNMGADESARFVLNALIADGAPVPGVDQAYMVNGHFGTLEELKGKGISVSDSEYQQILNDVLDNTVGKENNPSAPFAQKYENVIKRPDANK
nr:WXG100 family type VII secretion target [Mycobacteroides salmoniphilum]